MLLAISIQQPLPFYIKKLFIKYNIFMNIYNDEQNEAGVSVLFMAMQMFMLLVVYGFVYTSILGIKLAIQEYGYHWMTYLPEVAALIVYPVVLSKTRKMFKHGKKLQAIAWTLSWGSLIIILLYTHLSQLVKM